eukprot:TRINITY_DN5319_c0_g2_i23.p2 TRINITY_DN5319_c0_g2~~TRINITY_DN5319_c0_g2_i23.p2  ORF type:complete len:122 (+),score=0.97 TRINITY_DN5319_c0_g2_i23:107-472(+)
MVSATALISGWGMALGLVLSLIFQFFSAGEASGLSAGLFLPLSLWRSASARPGGLVDGFLAWRSIVFGWGSGFFGGFSLVFASVLFFLLFLHHSFFCAVVGLYFFFAFFYLPYLTCFFVAL